MFRHYFKTAFRNLWKEKTFTTLNILGLTAAFGIAFLLCMYGLFELSYDQFHENKNGIYQIYTDNETPRGTESEESYPVPFAVALQSEVPGVKHISKFLTQGSSVSIEDKIFRITGTWVDPDFFAMFTFPVLKGNDDNPIQDKSSVALTQTTAARLFGDKNAIGKTFMLQQEGNQIPVTVTAILKDHPAASSIQFEAIFNFKNLPDHIYADNLNQWDLS